MIYNQTIEFLFSKLPMYSRVGAAAYKKDLTNTIALCNYLNHPQKNFKSIHIAGTNGKGSVSHMLAAIFQQAGYKTGLYTSPHLKDFRERIKVNGKMVDENFVIDFTKKIKPLIETLSPSFFEITVAMSFEYFTQQKVEIAIIETGLGGRLDSTNVIVPVLSVITNIGWDHMNMLGDTLEKIAFEKAGIIKKNIPVVIGETLPETERVFLKKASEENSEILFAENRIEIKDSFIKNDLLYVNLLLEDEELKVDLDLTADYQIKNVRTAVCAIQQLKKLGWKINKEHLCNALRQVKKITGLYGRWQILRQEPKIIADVAHNLDGIKQVIAQLKNTSYKNLHIVIGMAKDKDVTNILSLLPINAQYYFTQANIPRAMPAKDLAGLAQTITLKGNTFENVNDAINDAIKNAANEDLILICGSVFLIGEIENLFD